MRLCPANQGHDTRSAQAWLGHKNIQHTVRYTELAPTASRTSGGESGFNRGERENLHAPW